MQNLKKTCKAFTSTVKCIRHVWKKNRKMRWNLNCLIYTASIFTLFQQHWMVYPIGQYICPSVCMLQNVRLCTTKKRLNLEAPILAPICMLTRYICQPTFIQSSTFFIVTFKVKESNRVHWKVHVIISQTVTDMAHIAIANKYKIAYRLSIGICISDLGPF